MAYPNNLPEGNIKQYDDAFEWWKQAIINEDELEGFGHEEFYVPIGVYFPSGNFTRAAFYTWIRNYWSKPPSGELYTYQLPVLTGQDKWDKKTLNDWGRAKLFELNIFGNVTNGGSTSSTPAITMSGRYGINNWTRSSLLFMRFGFKQFLEYGGLVFHDTPKYMQSDSIYMPPTVIIEVDTEDPDPVIGITDVTHNSARIVILDQNWFNQQDVTGYTLSWKSTNQTTWSTKRNSLNLTGLSGSTGYQAYITLEGERSIVGSSNIVSFATEATPQLTVSRSSITVDANVTSFTFNITSNLSWSITDNQSWISVSPTSGSGNRSNITVTLGTNHGSQRSGTVTITGGGITRTISVTQRAVQLYPVQLYARTSAIQPYVGADNPDAAMNNMYLVNAHATTSAANIGIGTRFYTSSTAVANLQADSKWYKVGNTPIAIMVDAGGHFVQSADTSQFITLSSVPQFASSGGSRTVSVTSNTDWIVSNSPSWITIGSGSGSGNGSFTATASSNSGNGRSGNITVRSLDSMRTATVSVSQAAAAASAGVFPSNIQAPASGGSQYVEVRAPGQSWTVNIPFGAPFGFSVTPMSGSGTNMNVRLSIPSNPFNNMLLFTFDVNIGGTNYLVTVNQAGAPFGGMANTPYNFTPPETLEGMTIEGELKDNDNE